MNSRLPKKQKLKSTQQLIRLRFAPSSTPTADNVLELNSDHEEADTRMILHAFQANANQSDKIVVCSPVVLERA